MACALISTACGLLQESPPGRWISYWALPFLTVGSYHRQRGHGPAAVGTAELPDLHYFCGRGAKDVVPLWRDAEATQPNLAAGLLDTLRMAHGTAVSARSLFAYAYGILTQPAYLEMFWDELEIPPPRLPITKDAELFQRVAEHGGRLMYLHTYGGSGSVAPMTMALCRRGQLSVPRRSRWSSIRWTFPTTPRCGLCTLVTGSSLL